MGMVEQEQKGVTSSRATPMILPVNFFLPGQHRLNCLAGYTPAAGCPALISEAVYLALTPARRFNSAADQAVLLKFS